jgi:hypothetical protein
MKLSDENTAVRQSKVIELPKTKTITAIESNDIDLYVNGCECKQRTPVIKRKFRFLLPGRRTNRVKNNNMFGSMVSEFKSNTKITTNFNLCAVSTQPVPSQKNRRVQLILVKRKD